jgi:hypothetical protein
VASSPPALYGRYSCGDGAILVILPDVPVSPVEQFLIGMQLVLQERLAEFLLHQPLALARELPVGEADFLHDVVNIRDDALDDVNSWVG